MYDDAQIDFWPLFKENQGLSTSVGLYTHDDGRYALIYMQLGLIKAAKLNFTTTGDALVARFKTQFPSGSTRPAGLDTREASMNLESYVLGQASSRSNWVNIGTYDNSEYCIAYGWNFNWRGDKAIVCAHKVFHNIDDETDYVRQTLWELTVVEDGNGEITASTAILEQGNWEPDNADPLVWRPSSSSMAYGYYVGTHEARKPGYGDNPFDVPVYAFYDSSGAPVIIRYGWKVLDPGKTEAEHIAEADLILCASNGFQGKSLETLEGSYEGTGKVTKKGFYVAGNDQRLNNVTDGYYEKKRLERNEGTRSYGYISRYNSSAYADYFTEDELAALAEPIYCDGSTCYVWVYNGDNHYYEERSVAYKRQDLKSILVIPRHCPESVYIATETAGQTVMIYTHKWGDSSQKAQKRGKIDGVWTALTPYYFLARPSYDTSDPDPSCASDDPGKWPTGSGWGDSDWDEETETVTTTPYNVCLNLVTSHEPWVEVDNMDFESYNDLGLYAHWFHPAILGGGPPLNAVNNFQSVLGSAVRVESGFTYGAQHDSGYVMGTNTDLEIGNNWGILFWLGNS